MPETLNLTAHAARNRAVWNADAPNWVALGARRGRAPRRGGGCGRCRRRSWGSSPTCRAWTWSTSAAARATGAPGSHRLGARPVGLDLSEEQLATARELQAEHGIEFPLIHASAEAPPLPDASFDVVFSEYGAAIWCDPYVWIPEAHRLLRPGGRLIFLCNSVLAMLCSPLSDTPTGETLVRPQRGLHSDRMAGPRRHRLPPAPRRADQAAARHRLRGRGAPRDLRPGRRPG